MYKKSRWYLKALKSYPIFHFDQKMGDGDDDGGDDGDDTTGGWIIVCAEFLIPSQTKMGCHRFHGVLSLYWGITCTLIYNCLHLFLCIFLFYIFLWLLTFMPTITHSFNQSFRSLSSYVCKIFLKKSIFEKIPVFYPDKSNFIHPSMDFFKILDFLPTLLLEAVWGHLKAFRGHPEALSGHLEAFEGI